jgi:hypothetical protein
MYDTQMNLTLNRRYSATLIKRTWKSGNRNSLFENISTYRHPRYITMFDTPPQSAVNKEWRYIGI